MKTTIAELKDAIKKRRREITMENRKKYFDSLPKERRAVFESLGLNPYKKDGITYR